MKATQRSLVGAALLAGLLWVPGAGAAEEEAPLRWVGFVAGRDEIVLAGGRDGLVTLALPDLHVLRRFSDPRRGRLTGVALAGNGRWLAASHEDTPITVWNLESGEEAFSIPRASARPPSFLFHPADDVLLVAQDERLERWDAAGGEPIGDLRSIRGIERMSLSADGRHLVTFGADSCQVDDGLWDLCLVLAADGLVLAREDFAPLRDPAGGRLRALSWVRGREISVVWEGSQKRREFRLRAGDLRMVSSDWVEGDPDCWSNRGVRAAPRAQTCDRSSDGSWRAMITRKYENRQKGMMFWVEPVGPPFLELSRYQEGEYQAMRKLDLE